MNRISRDQYIPALKYDWLTVIYDPLIRWTLRESVFKKELIRQADIKDGQQVLDLGCGTATLTLLVKQLHPQAEVTGLDGDPKILVIAQKKTEKSRLSIRLEQGMSYDLPFGTHSFDRVVSSLFFHHLTKRDKLRTFNEVYRVLRPGGELHVADWGKPRNRVMRGAFYLVQLLDGFQTTGDNVDGLLPKMIRDAGFGMALEIIQFQTVFGSLSLYKANKTA